MQNLKLLLAGAFLFVGAKATHDDKYYINGKLVAAKEYWDFIKTEREKPNPANAPTSTRPAKPKDK